MLTVGTCSNSFALQMVPGTAAAEDYKFIPKFRSHYWVSVSIIWCSSLWVVCPSKLNTNHTSVEPINCLLALSLVTTFHGTELQCLSYPSESWILLHNSFIKRRGVIRVLGFLLFFGGFVYFFPMFTDFPFLSFSFLVTFAFCRVCNITGTWGLMGLDRNAH